MPNEHIHVMIPAYDADNQTLQEYCEFLQSMMGDWLVSFKNEAVQVRLAMLRIRKANTLNQAKVIAREFMESRGGS